MRVLRIITRLNIGGPATHVMLADQGLQRRGWDTLLLYGQVEPDELEVDVTRFGVPTLKIPNLGRAMDPIRDGRAWGSILREIRRFRPNVIHTHLSKAGLLGRSAGMAVSRAPRIHTFHGTVFGGYFSDRMSAAIVRAERILGQHSARVIALSEIQRAELLDNRIAPPSRITIVPLGLDLDRFGHIDRAAARLRLGIPADATVIAAVGRLVPIKRVDRLIRVMSLVRRHVPSARLYVVGDGSERSDLEKLSSTLGLTDIVTFVGWSVDTPHWYAAADVVALTSEREGTPLSLIEAAAAGRPAVATDVGGVADVVIEGITGFLVPPDDIASLADRLTVLAASPELRAQIGGRGRANVERFGAGRLTIDLENVYRETLSTSGPA